MTMPVELTPDDDTPELPTAFTTAQVDAVLVALGISTIERLESVVIDVMGRSVQVNVQDKMLNVASYQIPVQG